jgi:hypothetical protein
MFMLCHFLILGQCDTFSAVYELSFVSPTRTLDVEGTGENTIFGNVQQPAKLS